MRSKVIYFTALFAGLGIFSYAAEPQDTFKNALERGISMNPQGFVVNVTDNASRQAAEIYKNMQGTLNKAETLRETLSFDPNTGKLSFDRVSDNVTVAVKTEKSNKYFNADERLYIFISSSMPSELLERYSQDIDILGIGANAVFVLRGCLPSGGGFNGCKNFNPTVEFIKSFIVDNGTKARRNQVWIDSVLFRKYEITEVPSFVYAKGINRVHDMGSEGDDRRLTAAPQWWKSTGDWSLEYHIKELKEKSGAESLSAMGRVIERNDVGKVR